MWPVLRSALAVSLCVVLQPPADEQLIRAARDQSNAAIAKHDLKPKAKIVDSAWPAVCANDG